MDKDVIDLLNRVKCCVDESELRVECGFIPKGSSKKQIFESTCNIWRTAGDAKIYNKFMNDKLNYAKSLGLIINESGKADWKDGENWGLTEAGEAYLGQRERGKMTDAE